MKTLIGTFDLLNRLTGKFEDAQLYRGLDAKNLGDFEEKWRPLFEERRRRARPEELLAANLQDAHWDWSRKAALWGNLLAYEAFTVEAEALTQGLMYVNKTRLSRVAGQQGAPLIYVELLATAPWNRHGITEKPKYKGVGQILTQAAISLSIEEEFKGRVGLHSLPQSESWYREVLGMIDLGPDPHYQNLKYFEMTAEQAERLIK
jgi:hypothetical protein